MSECLTGYHKKMIELTSDLVNHGWGDLIIHAESLKDNAVKIEIRCGKQYVFFVKKDIYIDESKLL